MINTSKILNLILAVCLVILLIVNFKLTERILSKPVETAQMTKSLFDKTKIGSLELKNRFIRASVGDNTPSGEVTDEMIDLYMTLAKGGVGTIITGYTLVDGAEKEAGIMAMYNDSFIEGGRKLAEAVHQNDSKILMELVYLGSNIRYKPTSEVLGVSSVKNLQTGIVPKEMTIADIHRIQTEFADAALRAKKAGFDGVEIHACHGYLLHQFAAPYYNNRTDNYGGSRENRYRMTIETYKAIRNTVGKDFQIWVKVQSQDGFEGGVTNEDCLYLCEELAKIGIDAIEVSGNFREQTGEAYFRDIAAKIAGNTSVPVILTGGNRDYRNMEKLINETKVKYIGMARPLIQQADLINKLYEQYGN